MFVSSSSSTTINNKKYLYTSDITLPMSCNTPAFITYNKKNKKNFVVFDTSSGPYMPALVHFPPNIPTIVQYLSKNNEVLQNISTQYILHTIFYYIKSYIIQPIYTYNTYPIYINTIDIYCIVFIPPNININNNIKEYCTNISRWLQANSLPQQTVTINTNYTVVLNETIWYNIENNLVPCNKQNNNINEYLCIDSNTIYNYLYQSISSLYIPSSSKMILITITPQNKPIFLQNTYPYLSIPINERTIISIQNPNSKFIENKLFCEHHLSPYDISKSLFMSLLTILYGILPTFILIDKHNLYSNLTLHSSMILWDDPYSLPNYSSSDLYDKPNFFLQYILRRNILLTKLS